MRDYDRERRDVPERRYAYDFDQNLREYVLRSLEPFLRGTRALELGCYEGDFTKLLLGRFPDVTVVEGSPESIARTREATEGRATLLEGRFETVELPERYDSIFLVHSLEHLDDPVGVLRRLPDWLAPDGRAFLVAPNAHALSRQIAVKMGLLSHHAVVTEAEATHGHRCTYSLDTLERDARAAGLLVRHRGGVFVKPFANVQFDRLLQTDIVDPAYLEACYQLGAVHPDLCASIYVVCESTGAR